MLQSPRYNAQESKNRTLTPHDRPVFIQGFQAEYRVAQSLLTDPPMSAEGFLVFSANRFLFIDSMCADVIPSAEQQFQMRVECGMKCIGCCSQHVLISTSEAVYIALHMRNHGLEIPELAETAKLVADMSFAERFRKVACPFLHESLCQIYQVRPHVCRSYFSFNRHACYYLDSAPVLSTTQAFASGVTYGGDYALMKYKYQVGVFELANGVSQALKPGAIESWLAGGTPFELDDLSEQHCFMLKRAAQNILKPKRPAFRV